MMLEDKINFLKNDFTAALRAIPTDKKPAWGKMTLQQMIEHFSDYVGIASGKAANETIVTPEENLQKMQDFLMSEKPFKENTPNSLLSETPPPVRNKSKEDAIEELEKELNYFFSVFENSPNQTSRNPFFGDLDYKMNVQLLHKHAQHHLKQFGVVI